MVLFPNCKINLGLNIVRKRNDAFHDLETVFYPMKLYDALEIIPSQGNNNFSQSGIPINSDAANNLCVKAYELLKKDFPQIASIKMHLHKVIPVGGGLGGGSSDAAFTIRLLDQEFDLGLTTGKLIAYALELGSDCPFFIINEPCYAAGRGELLETIQLDLSAWKFVVVHPRIQVDTSLAYSQISPSPSTRSIKEIIQQPPETWKTELKNDFEPVIFKQHPAIKTIKEELYQSGAVYSSLSGSGSSVFGLFSKKQEMQLNFPPNYFVKELLG